MKGGEGRKRKGGKGGKGEKGWKEEEWQEFSLNFPTNVFLVVTLQQVHPYVSISMGPWAWASSLYLAPSRVTLPSSFTLTYKAFY